MNVSVVAASVFAVMGIIGIANAQPAIQRDALPAPGASPYPPQHQEEAKARGNAGEAMTDMGRKRKTGKKRANLQPQRVSLPGCPAGLTLACTSASADTPSRAQAADTA